MEENDLRKPRTDWQSQQLTVITNWVRNRLYPIAEKIDAPIEHLALAWALYQKYIDFIIIGATSTNQVKSNLKANELELSQGVVEKIDNAYSELEAKIESEFGQNIREFRGLNEKYY